MITKYKLFEQKDAKWNLILDISKIWKDSLYENVNELELFNDRYINFLNQEKNLIIKNTSEEAWNKLQELMNRLNESKNDISKSISVWDDIYDWGDTNLVQIKAESEENKDF